MRRVWETIQEDLSVLKRGDNTCIVLNLK